MFHTDVSVVCGGQVTGQAGVTAASCGSRIKCSIQMSVSSVAGRLQDRLELLLPPVAAG